MRAVRLLRSRERRPAIAKKKHIPERMNLEDYFTGDLSGVLEKEGYHFDDRERFTLWQLARVGGGKGKRREEFADGIIAVHGQSLWEVFTRQPDAALATLTEMRALIQGMTPAHRLLVEQGRELKKPERRNSLQDRGLSGRELQRRMEELEP